MKQIFFFCIPACARMSARSSGFERSAADQILIAVEQHHFDGNLGSGDELRSGRLRRLCNPIAECNASGLREAKGLRGDCRVARRQACSAAAAYLDMLDNLARRPGPVDRAVHAG